MIEQIMYFALGALAAALVTIALLPALWRRAVRLTRARLEATMPLTPGEIAAEKDHLRARFAVDLRRKESDIETAVAALHRAKSEIGDKLTIIHQRDLTLTQNAARIGELERALMTAREAIEGLEATGAMLTRERDNLATTLEAARAAAQAQEEELTNIRAGADQKQGQIGDLQLQVESLSARLADSVSVTHALREDMQKRTEELRSATRSLREASAERQSFERKAAAAETMLADRTTAMENLQSERIRLIEQAGQTARERDQARVELGGAHATIDSLTKRVGELESGIAAARHTAQDTIGDLTRTIEQLRQERRHADDEISSLRFAKARLETDLARLRQRAPEHGAPAAEPARTDAAPASQPRPT